MKRIRIQHYRSPFGVLIIGSLENRVCLCDWIDGKRRDATDRRIQTFLGAEYETAGSEIIEKTLVQLDEYFARKREEFDIPLLMTGTDFQKAVWQELLNIPYGATLSYGELALRIGNPKAVRAVAAANGANPLSILVPCHRVTGFNNRLTGYGGGLSVKRALLELETPGLFGIVGSDEYALGK